LFILNYDPDAESPAFKSFLETIQPDPSVRAFLQRSIGYSLLGKVRERSFWILYGTGNNGKSIFVNLFNNLLGDYASATTTASVMAGKQNAIPNDIARLRGKRFIIIPETEENERLNSALVKALSAGDKVTARYLFGEFFDFYFSGKLWIATNHKPAITDHSKGFWDRLKIIPFSQDIPKDKVIKSDDLMAQLLAEAAGILNWALLGCQDYFDLDGLETPAVIQAEIDAYRREQDSISQFIEERCLTIEQALANNPDAYIIPAEYRVTNKDLYDSYKQFCQDNGEFLRSHRRLTQNMIERGFKQMNSGGRFWEGVRLIDGGNN
jgi:putative DNA primase/helicase